MDVGLSTAVHQYEVVISELLALSPVVVLDIGTPFLPAFPLLLDMCNEIVVVTEPSLLSLRRTAHLITELHNKGFGSAKTLNLVTVNHTRSDLTQSVTQIEEALHQTVVLGFPPAMELAERAVQMGQPMYMVQPNALISTQFTKLSEIIRKHIGK